MPDVITIRVASPSDAPTLCELLEQLGLVVRVVGVLDLADQTLDLVVL